MVISPIVRAHDRGMMVPSHPVHIHITRLLRIRTPVEETMQIQKRQYHDRSPCKRLNAGAAIFSPDWLPPASSKISRIYALQGPFPQLSLRNG